MMAETGLVLPTPSPTCAGSGICRVRELLDAV